MEFEDLTIPEVLEQIRHLSDDNIQQYYDHLVPIERAPTPEFWRTLDNRNDATLARRLCLLACVASGFSIIPFEFQLTATIALLSGKDSLVDVGTGYGKTWCMILPALLRPNRITLVISPLKRLQVNQVLEFKKFGIRTISINEDTPNKGIVVRAIEFFAITTVQRCIVL
ncbi:hypothetical protein EST38_g14229 [Candolleomyces aberdarensis]|uniref:DNA 3'-5' helicase n=1 Tax=Candolleomyces aberdarensis TaxID=2316362 RepID=A0A4Q2CZN3_9AGAR|nr:hypothetical protein EST38_g14229 [Candolleomyces aberdarensis]